MVKLVKIATVRETHRHLPCPDAIWNLQPTRHGLLPVATRRGGPLKISWEIHGEGPIQIVVRAESTSPICRFDTDLLEQFILGLGSVKSAWQRQTLYFGHERYKEYSVLVLDNRGIGDSDKPLMRYSTKEMALDVVEVLTHVKFVEPDAPPLSATPSAVPLATPAHRARTVHVVGLSMGGMIAQQLALLVPGQIASLSLCCTAAQIDNTSPIWDILEHRLVLNRRRSADESLQDTAKRNFHPDWLARPDDVHLPQRGTHRVRPPETLRCHEDRTTPPPDVEIQHIAGDQDAIPGPWYGMFGSNYERFVAQETHERDDPRYSKQGLFLQLIATLWHYNSPRQLAAMANQVGRSRIMVLHGTEDTMIPVPHGRKLAEHIQPGRVHIINGMGHAPTVERWDWYNRTLEELVQECEKLAGSREET